MKQRTPLWPYLLVLGFLFALSLAAPHGWHSSTTSQSTDELSAELAAAAAKAEQNSDVAAVVHGGSQSLENDALAQTSGPDVVATAPELEATADKVADVWQFDAAAELGGSHRPLDSDDDEPGAKVDLPMPGPSEPPAPGFGVQLPSLSSSGAQEPKAPPLKLEPEAPTQPFVVKPSVAESPGENKTATVVDRPALTTANEDAVDDDNCDELGTDATSSAGGSAEPKSVAEQRSVAEPSEKTHPDEGIAFEVPMSKFLSSFTRPALPKRSPPLAPISAATDTPPAADRSSTPQPRTALPIVPAELKPADMPPADADEVVASDEPETRAEKPAKASAWPAAASLDNRLEQIAAREGCCAWANDVEMGLQELYELEPADGQGAVKVLKRLRESSESASRLATAMRDRETAKEIRRTQYDLIRRLDLWDEVCAARLIPAEPTPRAAQRKRLELCLAQVRAANDQPGATPGLNDQLMLDKLAELAKQEAADASDRVTDAERGVAREVLSRLARRRVPPERRSLATEAHLAALGQQLRHWAAEPLEYTELLTRLENYERTESAADAQRLAEIRRQLTWSAEPAEQDLARRLEMHYRNANVRVAISAALIDRLLPAPTPTTEPVNEMILGAAVSGQSDTSTRLTVELVPDANTWRFNLVARGSVASQTRADSGPVTFFNQGQTTFVARKLILANAYGTRILPAVAEAAAHQSLNGLSTQYDSIPIVRSMVRNYAMGQHAELEGQAQAEAEQRVATRACARIDAEFEPRINAAQDRFRNRVVEPLKKLGLDPVVVTMETSASRLIFRGRLAAIDQLGAQTARPEAPADSLASAQIHESAVNNLLDHLDLAGRTFTLPELLRHVNSKLSRGEPSLPPDLPDNVELAFAKQQPLHVRCDHDELELVLNIAEIRQGKHHWRDFEVRAKYRPAPNGLSCELQRVGSIELGGQYQGRAEVTLRGIFSKVLSKDRKLKLLPESICSDRRLAGLEVTQFVIDDGWIGLAIGPKLAVARR